ncbi:hypothetical protein L6452_45209 [Arctium lappa]|nr:hypothetical protein L6452_45209 [Arctium lappa]
MVDHSSDHSWYLEMESVRRVMFIFVNIKKRSSSYVGLRLKLRIDLIFTPEQSDPRRFFLQLLKLYCSVSSLCNSVLLSSDENGIWEWNLLIRSRYNGLDKDGVKQNGNPGSLLQANQTGFEGESVQDLKANLTGFAGESFQPLPGNAGRDFAGEPF